MPDKISGLFLFLLFILSGRSGAQNMRLLKLGVNDGLSQSMTTCIFQDSRGFVWVGTGGGLNKYDGNRFTVYKYQSNLPYSISNNTIRTIMEDRWGNLWLGTEGGLNMFDRKQNRFYCITEPVVGEVRPLFFEQDSLLYFFANGKGYGTYHLIRKELKLYYKNPDPAYYYGGILGPALQQKKGEYRLPSSEGIYIFNTLGTVPECKPDTVLNAILPSLYTHSILTDEQSIWIGTDKGSVRYQPITKKYESYPMIEFLHRDPDGKLWGYSQSNGLFSFDQPSQKFKQVSFDNSKDLPKNIKTLYHDRYKNLWIGTDGYGLFIHSASANKFKLYNRSSHFENGSLSSDFVKCFAVDNQKRTWVGTYGDGVNMISADGNRITHLLGKNTIQTLCFYKQNMWIATEDGLYCCDTKTMRVKPFHNNQKDQHIYYITPLNDGRLLLCTSTGLYIFLPGSNQPLTKLLDVKEPVIHVYEDRQHTLWIAGNYRTYFSVPPYGTIQQLFFKQDKGIPVDFRAKCFAADKKGSIWIAGSRGLVRYRSGSQNYYNEKQGLPDQMVYSILEDHSGSLWLSTNKGVSCLDPIHTTFKNYDVRDGLQSNEFNSGAFYRDNEGQIYFGGVNGFNIFHPSRIREQHTSKSGINLIGLKLSDLDYPSLTDYSEINTLNLPHADNTLSFEFASTNFGNMQKSRYAYMLEGVDGGWVESGSRGFARYANIRPGTYVFKARVLDNDETGSIEHPLLFITINPPWWQTWWALICWLFLTGGIIYLFARYLINRRLAEKSRELEKLQAVNRERLRISKDMHDDLGSGLSKIAIMSELLKQQRQEKKSEQLEKISETAGTLIDSMGHIIWAMNPDNDRIGNLVAYIREHSTEFLESCGLHYDLQFPDHTPEIALTQEARRNIFLVIKESLNNIVKHAAATMVSISITIADDTLTVTISDNGKGFDAGKIREEANGLKNMKKRMEQVQGIYQISSEKGKGTLTILSLRVAVEQ